MGKAVKIAAIVDLILYPLCGIGTVILQPMPNLPVPIKFFANVCGNYIWCANSLLRNLGSKWVLTVGAIIIITEIIDLPILTADVWDIPAAVVGMIVGAILAVDKERRKRDEERDRERRRRIRYEIIKSRMERMKR